MTNYEKQAKQIEALTKEINKEAAIFAKNAKHPHFGDLNHVIEELEEALAFLSDSSKVMQIRELMSNQ